MKKNIEYQTWVKRMQDDNMIRREGSQKSGRWIIIQ